MTKLDEIEALMRILAELKRLARVEACAKAWLAVSDNYVTVMQGDSDYPAKEALREALGSKLEEGPPP